MSDKNYVCMMNGYEIIITTKKCQIRTHKKKRINKKWAKKYGYIYFDIQDPGQAVVIGHKIYMTLRDFEALSAEINKSMKGVDRIKCSINSKCMT